MWLCNVLFTNHCLFLWNISGFDNQLISYHQFNMECQKCMHRTIPHQIKYSSEALLHLPVSCWTYKIISTTIILYHKYDVRSLVKYRYRSNNKRININLWFSWSTSFSKKKKKKRFHLTFNVLKRALTAPFCFVWLICEGLLQRALCARQFWTPWRIVANCFLVTYHCIGNRYKSIRNVCIMQLVHPRCDVVPCSI